MATSRGFAQFERRMKQIAKLVIGNTAETVRRAAIAADQVAVLATPVDTGRARANWRVGIGARPTGYDENDQDPSGSAAISQGQSTISTWKPGEGAIYISNNVPYIVPLDEGSSAQAPNGMSSLAVQAAQAHLGNAQLLKGV